ncbi:MAG: hypothetical protein PHQ36_01675 [Anaerolineales bacterium]|nr:hypothetical protein [Anaerolineales bacterium]
MEFTWQLALILGGIVGMILGWIIGFFDSNNRSAKKIQNAEEKAENAVKEAERKIAQASQIPAPTPQVTIQDDPGLLRLKNEQGRYALEMDGMSIGGALTPDKKKRLIELLTAIRPYLEGSLPPQPAPAPAAPRPAPTVVSAPVVQTPPPAAVVVDAPKPAAKIDDKKTMAALSIVAQIDSVLQARLINTPLDKRGIRVYESPEGGVQVEVGLEKFETIDDVTDPEVKAVIRAAVAEWEKKFTPGM